MKKNRRIQHREHVKIPIIYTRQDDNIYHEALTCDISSGGLCFNANQQFKSGDCCIIKSMDRMPQLDPGPLGTAYAGQVKWCTENGTDSGYKVGIKHIAPFIPSKSTINSCHQLQCELCGSLQLEGAVDIHCGIILCPDCFADCYHRAGETLKGTIGRFMAGNVI